jgi:hypothetical protein
MKKHTIAIDWGQGQTDHARPTIPVFAPSELASPDEKARLFAALETFVNLEDTYEAYDHFLRQSPTFFPASIKYKDENVAKPQQVDWFKPECHRFALVYRDVLRLIWVKDQNALSMNLGSFLLGIKHSPGESLLPFISGFDQAWNQLKACYNSWLVELPDFFVHWGLGAFLFNPITDFQKAAYALFRESWRAKTCPCCSRYFVAEKVPQVYCSPGCYGISKKKRGLDWWRSHGRAWRTGRKASKGKSKRKRGK